MSDVFVGRLRELERLRGAAAPGRLVTISGAAGAGKSALLRRYATDIEDGGWLVGVGRSYESAGTPPYWAWTDALAGLPGLAGVVTALKDPAASAAQATPSDLFGFLERIIDELAASALALDRVLALLFEDLHWADASCIALLRHLLRRPAANIAVVATIRPAEASAHPGLRDALAEAGRDGRLVDIPVPALSIEEAARVVDAVATAPFDDATIARLHRRSGGNAFFLVELARAGSAAEQGADLPASILHVLGLRLERLSATERALLNAMAVIGAPSRASFLARVAGIEPGDVDRAVDSLVRAGLCTHEAEGYRAAHDLVQETLLGLLGTREAEQLHARSLDALEEAGASPADLAAHALKAGLSLDDRRAYEHCMRAASTAARAFAFEDAARWYGLAASAATVGAAGRERLAALLAAGEASHHGGRHDTALHWFEDAAQEAAAYEDGVGYAEAAIGFEDAFLAGEFSRGDRRPIHMLTSALGRLAGTGTALHARVSAALARARFFAGEHEAGLHLAAAALTAAETAGDPAALAYALHAQRITAWGTADHGARLTMATRLRDTATRVGASELAMEGRQWHYYALLETGSPESARALAGYDDAAHLLRVPAFLYKANLWRAMSAVAAGHISVAAPIIERGRALAGDPDSRAVVVDADLLALTAALASGREADAIPVFERYVATYPALPMFRFILARLLATTGSALEARRLVTPDFDEALRGVANDHFRLIALVFLGETAATLDDARLAAVASRALDPYAGRVATVPPVLAGAADATRARLSLTLRDDNAAVEQYRSALDIEMGLGANAFGVRTSVELAGVLLRLGHGRKEAHELLARATALVAGFDPPGNRHVEDALARTGWSSVPGRPAGLSLREVEVLRLLADGLTNREVAERLVLSERTVDRHVANAYAKIGAHNRAEATRFAVDNLR